MAYQLKNQNLAITIDSHNENYNCSRFDCTGKIRSIKFRDVELLSSELELQNNEEDKKFGRGLYNEFGTKNPLGFLNTDIGDYYHKVGVGLIHKKEIEYNCQKPYPFIPLEVDIQCSANQINFRSKSRVHKGYSYTLHKRIILQKNEIQITYILENSGTKVIKTNEYNHNFLRFKNCSIDKGYVLTIPTDLRLEELTELVNKEKVMSITDDEIIFLKKPKEAFFISTELKNRDVDAFWKLENKSLNIGMSEVGDFKTRQFHLWGCAHVISPEVFIDIEINPSESKKWTRTYSFYELN